MIAAQLRRTTLPLICFSLLILVPAQTARSQASAAPPSWEQSMRTSWKGLHMKLFEMARDTLLPDTVLGTRPHPASRTMLDELRHVTIGLEMSRAALLKQPFDYAARVRADSAKSRARAVLVAEMERAMRESFATVDSISTPSLVFWIEHQAEHYGKLVSNYRMAGIVPPISRPRK